MKIKYQKAESLAFVNEDWSSLRYENLIENSIFLRKEPSNGSDQAITIFHEHSDYIVDWQKGRIKRTKGSSIPDWSQNVFYNQENFDHTQYDRYGNSEFTVYIDYEYEDLEDLTECHDIIKLSQKFVSGTNSGTIRYVVFGDSISTGAEASREENMYFNRFADHIRKLYPDCLVEVCNRAIGGEDSSGGLKRVYSDVVALEPDLVTIAFGMNDQNADEKGGHFVEPDDFEKNISSIVEVILHSTQAEVILVTPCLPNPKWKYSSGDAKVYAEIIRNIGKRFNIAVVDVQRLWLQELEAGKSHESLLMNNINHPNDYGHQIYYKALKKLI